MLRSRKKIRGSRGTAPDLAEGRIRKACAFALLSAIDWRKSPHIRWIG